MPDVAVIFLNRAVGGEIAAAGDVIEASLGPFGFVFIKGFDFLAGFHIFAEIGKDKELVVAIHDFVEDHAETVGIAFAPWAGEEGIHDVFDLLVFVIDVPWAIGAIIDELLDFFSGKTEDDFVFPAGEIGDFDIRAV